MAYQPKFAKGSPRRGAAPEQQPAKPPKKKRSKLHMVLFVLLGIVVVPVCSLLTGILLQNVFENVGRPKPETLKNTPDVAISQLFDQHVTQEIAAARNILVSSDKPELPDAIPEETEPPVRKRYWLEDDVVVAPEPDQSKFGETEDPTTLGWLLEDARWILEGQELFFNTEVQLFAGSKVRYYLDDSIFAVTWKEVHDGSVYTFSEIKVSDPSQFRRHLAGGEFGSDMQYMTTEMAQSVNAVVASSGDFYRFRDFGICVYEGQVRRVEGTYAETCMIDRDGNMRFVYGGEITTTAKAQEYVNENDIHFSLCFGPVLIDNYEVVDHTWYGVGEIDEGYARAGLLQMGDLHYIVVTANTEGPNQEIPTVKMFTRNIAVTGCRMAYCLDGGQTAAIVMNDELINRPVYGTQRKISDIIYFATAIPDGGDDNG